MKRFVILAGFCLIACSAAQMEDTDKSLVAPSTNSSAAQEDVRLKCNAEAQAQINAFVSELDATAIEILHNGESIYSYGDVARTDGLYVASVRKSLLALLYGPWVENGTIDLEATLGDLNFDDIEGLSPQEKRATVRHLITSRSGIYHPASNSGDDENKPARGSKAPGEYFLYNNWDFNAAGALFEQLTGQSIYTAFDDQIATPIGLQDYDAEFHNENRVKTDANSASKYPPYHFSLSARDMARVGQLVAQRGEWQGQQIISESWIEEMLSVHSTLEEVRSTRRRSPFAYGYMWWLVKARVPYSTARSSVWAQGAWGQKIMANAELGLSAGLVTEPRYLVEDGEERPVSVSTPDAARMIQMAWDNHQRCSSL